MTPRVPNLLKVRQRLDWQRFPSVVFESDDWGACELSRNAEDAEALGKVWSKLYGRPGPVESTLETPADLEALYAALEQHQGVDGLPAVFTAFTITGNPDYAGIAAHGFRRYLDVGIDAGFPASWERGDVVGTWREGMRRGVWAPEFHSNLHHTSPTRWMQRLTAKGPEGEAARAAFRRASYYQGVHLPEFEGMNVRQQFSWLKTGIGRFGAALKVRPAAAVTSDAYPVTETVWSILGIRTVCLKNTRNNRGEVVVYHTKPWNNQDYYAPMGAYEPMQDLVYLIRNVVFEDQGEAEALGAIQAAWELNEPAVVSTHRSHYVSLDGAKKQRGFGKLHELLRLLKPLNVRYLTTAEAGDLYRRGWSLRRFGSRRILRQYTGEPLEMTLPGSVTGLTDLLNGRQLALRQEAGRTQVKVPSGEYEVQVAEREEG